MKDQQAKIALDTTPIEITTPIAGHKVLIKPFATGRDKLAIREALTENLNIQLDEQSSPNREQRRKKQKQGVYGMSTTAAEKQAIIRMVISIDGITDGLLDRVLDMHETDYSTVTKKINEVTKSSSLDENSEPDDPKAQG